jgi:hypothetical protein
VLVFVRFLHILFMAAWLAASLWVAGDARRSLDGGRDEAMAFLGRARAALLTDRAAGALTIFTGLGLVHLANAWPPRLGLVVGFVLAIARAGLTDAVMAPALRRIAVGLSEGAEPATLQPHARRMASVSGLGHLAWLAALAGMSLPF